MTTDANINTTTVSAPAEATVSIAPLVATTEASVTPAPVVEAAKPAEAKPAEAVIQNTEATKPTETKTADATLLGAELVKPAEVKTEEAVKETEKPVEEVKEAPLPTYEIKLPEEFAADKTKLDEFTKELADLEGATKAEHAKMQEFGQKLIDRHFTEVKAALDNQAKSYSEYAEKIKNEWKESFIKDPEIGGNRQSTTLNAAVEFIKTHGGNEAQQTEFRKLMNDTGLGNHPAMIRMLANANVAYREGSPIPASKPMPSGPRSKVQTRYGKVSNT